MASTRSFPISISTPTSSSRCPTRSSRRFTCRAEPIPRNWQTLGVKVEVFRNYQEREAFAARHDVAILKTCTPYLAGNLPAKGEHCAWMESSAVIFANSVLGARTNTEGRESTSAAMLTGKIPDWGLHRAEHRLGTHRVDVRAARRIGDGLGHARILRRRCGSGAHPGVVGTFATPEIVRLKHFGAAASSSGGVEMYHIVGMHTGGRIGGDGVWSETPLERFTYGEAEQRQVYDRLNANASDPNVDYVMLGCPHAALDQLREAATLLDGKAGQRQLHPLDLHVARRREPGATAGIREGDQRRRRRGADRYLLGVCAGDSSGHQGGRARLGEAGALSAGDPGRAGVVRVDAGLHSRGRHQPLERGAAMTVSATIVLRGRGVVGGRAEGEALVTRETIPGWGGVNPQQGVITETHHELRGESFKDKVLVFRGAKGSSAGRRCTTRHAWLAPRPGRSSSTR